MRDKIKSKYVRLSKGQKLVALHIIKHPKEVLHKSIAELSRMVGVSESTVLRFCYAMEMSGYVELQAQLREELEKPEERQVESVLW